MSHHFVDVALLIKFAVGYEPQKEAWNALLVLLFRYYNHFKEGEYVLYRHATMAYEVSVHMNTSTNHVQIWLSLSGLIMFYVSRMLKAHGWKVLQLLVLFNKFYLFYTCI